MYILQSQAVLMVKVKNKIIKFGFQKQDSITVYMYMKVIKGSCHLNVYAKMISTDFKVRTTLYSIMNNTTESTAQ